MGSTASPEYPTDVDSAFKKARETKVTMQGKTGYFISERRLSAIRELITPMSGDVNPAFQARYDELVKEKLDVKATLLDSEAKLKEAITKVAKVTQEKEEAEAAAQVNYGGAKTHIELLNTRIAKLTDEKKRWMEEKNKVEISLDVEQANLVRDELDSLRTELKTARDELSVQKKLVATSEASHDLLNKQLRAAQLDVANATIEDRKVRFAAEGLEAEELLDRPFSEVSSVVKSLVGERGLRFFAKLEKTNREDARERAYNLLQALRSSNKAPVKSIASLAQILFDWIKNQTIKVRERVQPWIDMVASDLKAGTLKTYKEYRIALEHLVDGLAKASQKAKAEYAKTKGKQHWFKRIMSTISESYNDLKKNIKSAVYPQTTINLLKSGYNTVKSWFVAKPKVYRKAYVEDLEIKPKSYSDAVKDDILYDLDEEKAHFKEVLPKKGKLSLSKLSSG